MTVQFEVEFAFKKSNISATLTDLSNKECPSMNTLNTGPSTHTSVGEFKVLKFFISL
jgi:hypothetical protein